MKQVNYHHDVTVIQAAGPATFPTLPGTRALKAITQVTQQVTLPKEAGSRRLGS